jgi:hypothetical protein
MVACQGVVAFSSIISISPAIRRLAEIEPMLGYLSRLSARIDKRGMGTEPLAADVQRAQEAMQALRMRLHYLNCAGLGRHANQR